MIEQKQLSETEVSNMSHEEIMIVSKAHFDQVVLTNHNSSLKNDVGAVFVQERAQGGFYHLCASLGELLISYRAKNNRRQENQQKDAGYLRI